MILKKIKNFLINKTLEIFLKITLLLKEEVMNIINIIITKYMESQDVMTRNQWVKKRFKIQISDIEFNFSYWKLIQPKKII